MILNYDLVAPLSCSKSTKEAPKECNFNNEILIMEFKVNDKDTTTMFEMPAGIMFKSFW